jgi:cytochrome c
MNPCGGAANPCAGATDAVDPALVQVPDSKEAKKARKALEKLAKAFAKGKSAKYASDIRRGESLWKDRNLGGSGLSCDSCHMNNMQFQASFSEPYPHAVQMAEERAGLDSVHAAEMVQFCMVVPMMEDPLAWDSEELLALTAYTYELQSSFDPATAASMAAANPCAGANPCGNPCAANPCAANPCAGNPCAGANPCGNPCANPCSP